MEQAVASTSTASSTVLDLSQAPYDVLVHILSFVDPKTQVVSCRLVNSQWQTAVESESLRKRAIHLSKVPKHLPIQPWYIYYCYASGMLDRNLIQNPCGFEGGSGWIQAGIVQKWLVGSATPLRNCSPLPDKIMAEINQIRRTYIEKTNATEVPPLAVFSSKGFFECMNKQIIDLRQHKICGKLMDEVKPVITSSVWYAPEYEHCSLFTFTVELWDSRMRVLHRSQPLTIYREAILDTSWRKAEYVFDTYMKGVRYVKIVKGAVSDNYQCVSPVYRSGCFATLAKVVLTMPTKK